MSVKLNRAEEELYAKYLENMADADPPIKPRNKTDWAKLYRSVQRQKKEG